MWNRGSVDSEKYESVFDQSILLKSGGIMNMVKSLLAILTILTLSYSANVTISGIVTDTAGTAIAGASVKLLAGGQNTTTGTNGRFTLYGTWTAI